MLFYLFRFCAVVFLLWVALGDVSFAKTYFMWQPRLSLTTQYDDNVYFTSSDEVSDWLFYVCPGFLFTGKNASTSFMFDYEYQRVSYFSESSRNSDRHYITLNAYRKWGDRWHLSLSDSFVRSEDPIVLQDSIGVIRYEKIKYDYNLADLYLRYSLGGDSYWRFSYHDLLFKNRASGVENTASHNPYFDIVYWFSFPLGFHFQSGVNLGEFDYSPDFSEYNNSISLMYRPSLEGLLTIKMSVSNMYFSGGASDYDIYDFSCGYSYAFSDNLNVSFGVGYFYQDLDRGHDEEGPSGFLFVKWQKEAFSLYRRQYGV